MYNTEELKPIIEAAIKSSNSMREAASKTNLNPKTFFKYAKHLGLFKPNQSGKNIIKNTPYYIKMDEILKGLHPGFSTSKLAKRLFAENIKPRECEICKITHWNNQLAPLELDHIDGNPYNHKLNNLRILCPNCHAQTPTYRGRNCIKK